MAKDNTQEEIKDQVIVEVPLEETPRFIELMQNTAPQLKEMLKDENIIGLNFINDKKALVATILNVEKRKLDFGNPLPANESVDPIIPVTPIVSPVEQQVVVTSGWTKKMLAMKELCAKSEKVRIMIPFEIGERPGSIAELQINGFKLSAMKGVYIDLPKPFADMVQESWKQTSEAGTENLLDRIDEKTGKPMVESEALA